MVRRYSTCLSLTTLLFALNAQAALASIVSSVVITKTTPHALAGSVPQKKEVFLMPVHLTAQQKQKLLQDKAKISRLPRPLLAKSNLIPTSFELGMNNVPVLNQGKHGSCVTFAVTGAIDALIGKGDYISQLCNLELGDYLEKRGYYPSGWEGSDGAMVLNQIEQFGVISKENQMTKSCSGIKEYPALNEFNTGNPMSLEEFKLMSENLADVNGNHYLYWEPVLTPFQRFQWDDNNVEAEKMLEKVKYYIARKEDPNSDSRLTFGTIVLVNHCSAGACSTYHAQNDTWALTKEIQNDANPKLAGHQMIFTAYQDNAVVIDKDGTKHQGLLTLRNSWGNDVGDKGNYYMTYDYFKAFILDIQKITRINLDKQ